MNESLTSVEAMRMFGIIAECLGQKTERRSLSDRVMDFIDALHNGGFVIVPTHAGNDG